MEYRVTVLSFYLYPGPSIYITGVIYLYLGSSILSAAIYRSVLASVHNEIHLGGVQAAKSSHTFKWVL